MNHPESRPASADRLTPADHPRKPSKPPVWPGLVAACVVALAGAGVWGIRANAEAAQQRQELALNLAGLDGHQTCKLGWYKASLNARAGSTGLDGRTPDIYAPEMRVPGPPKVVACPMVKARQTAEPLLVLVRCDRFDLKCVEPQL